MRRLYSALLAGLLFAGIMVIPASAASPGTIADIAVANGNFTTLVKALRACGRILSFGAAVGDR